MEIGIDLIIICVFVGLLFGMVSVIGGIGGGVMYVLFMSLFMLLPITMAVDTSTFILLISSGAAFLTYLKDKRTDLKCSLVFGSFSILGSFLCTIIFDVFFTIDSTVLKLIFAVVMLIASMVMFLKARKSRLKAKNSIEEPIEFSLKDHDYKVHLKKGIPLFMLAGFLANLIGIGGGIINMPSLNMILEYPIHNATAISTTIIFFTAIYNTIVNIFLGQINYIVGILIGIGAGIGSIVGAKLSNKIPKVALQYFVAIVLTILSIRMFF
jgi:hypothetical protein